MADLFPINLDDQIACAAREVNMRKKVYPRWVSTGKMKQEEAEREIAVMESILNKLRGEK
jgi:hypothetical protein